jgi:WD40 repeat protein
VLGTSVVLGVDSGLYLWADPTRRSPTETKFDPAAVIAAQGIGDIDDSRVDPVCGSAHTRFIVVKLGAGAPIDSISAIGNDWLAIASSQYPVVHIFDKQLTPISRLIGHTAGISCLFPFENKLFSGSSDRTIKMWDVQTGQLQFAYHSHRARVSCLYLATGDDNEAFLFSGADDKTVMAWDVRRKRAVFTMAVADEAAPIALGFWPATSELTVLARPVSAEPERTQAKTIVYRFACEGAE